MSRNISHFFVLIVVAQTLALPLVAHASPPASSPKAVQETGGAKCSRQIARVFGLRDQLRPPTCNARRAELAGMGGPDCDPHYSGKGHEVWRVRPSFGPRASLPAPSREWVESCSL